MDRETYVQLTILNSDKTFEKLKKKFKNINIYIANVWLI